MSAISSRPSHIEIDLAALERNIATIRQWIGPEARLMAVVKADAYGHGAVPVSQAAQRAPVDFLGVAFLEEAWELKSSGVTAPIVLLYPEPDDRSAEAVRQGFYITISDIAQYQRIRGLVDDARYPIRYFIKVESGMNRYGMPHERLLEEIERHTLLPDSHMVGVTTNLADSTMNNPKLAQKQMDSFFTIMSAIKRHSDNGLYYSLEASGLLWNIKQPKGSLIRIGHLLYGLVPGGAPSMELSPVMSVKSRIAEIHDLTAGEGVGYGFTFIAQRPTRVATIPMGYADGYPWALSNKGQVLIRDRRAPIAGRICMDAFMTDVTDIPGCEVGDEVVLLGALGQEKIDAHEMGRWAGSFSYEILSRWSKRLPRIYK